MKLKQTLSLLLAIVLLLCCQGISAFATDTTEPEAAVVKLVGTFNSWEGTDMTTEDNKSFSTSLDLNAGSYQFKISSNDTLLSHAGTVKDTTAFVSDTGFTFSDSVNAKCTFVATGGSYTFTYNIDTNKVQVMKNGVSAPADTGENLKLNVNGTTLTAKKDDTITYNVYLKAKDVFEDIQAVVSFNEDKLALKEITSASAICPSIEDISYNCENKGFVAVNASNVDGYDFKTEKLFITLEFTVIGTGETALEYTVQDMSILGGNDSYYFYSVKQSDGADFREVAEVEGIIEPTTATTPATTESTPISSGTTDNTEPSVTTTAATSTSASVPASSASSTASTAPTTTQATQSNPTTGSTDPSETESTAPKSEYDLGDVTRDGKLNIRDATLIQKFLAKIVTLDEEQLELADFREDGKINIKDATQIQKKIANII